MSRTPPGSDFVHLHVHTDHSLLDGHGTIPELVDEIVRLKQPAIAVTDHGSLSGIRKLWETATAAGIKPIIGCEFYVAPESRFTKQPVYWGGPLQRSDDISGQGSYCHITALATSDEGLRNLFRLYATSYADGFYRKPRIDLDSLATHNRGLVVTTGCAGGLVATRIRLGQYEDALSITGNLRDIFGDNLFVEIMSHDNPVDAVINPSLIRISKSLEVPLVATNDSHYTTEGDARAHDALLCLQTGQRLNGVRSFRFEGNGYHLRSRAEMEVLFSEIPDAVSNSLVVAERVEEYREVFSRQLRFPRFSDDAVRDLRVALDAELENPQVRYEFETIVNLGFADYFMVVADICEMAREIGARVGPGRGSACGSRIAHRLKITTVDPDEHDLLFERFLNPERVSLPDIDVDVSDDKRDALLQRIRGKYGDDCVAQIGTLGTIGAKASLHDSARVLGKSRNLSNQLTYRLPPAKFGRSPSLLEGSWNDLSHEESETLGLARSLEGRIRNKGIHAAGVVVAPTSLLDILPVYKPESGKGNWVTDYDMDDVEAVGLVKMDWLGLKTLGVIDECLRMLAVSQPTGWKEASYGVMSTELEHLADNRTYELLATGHTLGIFQLDSPGMQQLLRSIKPTGFSDISAVLALYRPGPMGVNAHHSYAKRKNGKERVSYPHSELEGSLARILGPTYGLVVYQEQVLEILREVAGYTYATAELIFDAMRKKKTEKMLEAKPDFTKRMLERGYSQECVDALWAVLLPFSDYSFNKSHTTGYGIISYWTAFLKTHFPYEWMAACLTRETDPKTLPEYVSEVTRMGIPILAPDINLSEGSWTPTADGIRYGLSSIKNFGEKAYLNLITKRPFQSLDDFFRRANAKTLNKKTLEVLIMSGAMDSLCPDREELLTVCEMLANRALAERKLARQGQMTLYSTPYSIATTGAFNRELRQQWERTLLNTTLTQQKITLTARRWLAEEEFYYLRETVERNPGRQKITLSLGYSTISVGYCEWGDKLRRQIEALGCFDVTLD